MRGYFAERSSSGDAASEGCRGGGRCTGASLGASCDLGFQSKKVGNRFFFALAQLFVSGVSLGVKCTAIAHPDDDGESTKVGYKQRR